MRSTIRGYIMCVRATPGRQGTGSSWEWSQRGTIAVALLREWFGTDAVTEGCVTFTPDDAARVSAYLGYPVSVNALLRTRRSLTLIIQADA